MNRKALINWFIWPGLPFCARLNNKPCPDLDLSSRPCHYWLTNNQFFWLNIDIIVTVIHCHCSPSLFKLRISYRLARFPHLSQARSAIPAPVAATLIWRNFPLCHWFASGQMTFSGQMTSTQTFELTRWAQETREYFFGTTKITYSLPRLKPWSYIFLWLLFSICYRFHCSHCNQSAWKKVESRNIYIWPSLKAKLPISLN